MSNMTCSNCQAALPPGAKFCPSCGAPTQENTSSQPLESKPTEKAASTRTRDIAIVIGTMLVLSIAYFGLRSPAGPPPPPPPNNAAMMDHPEVEGEDMEQAMSSLAGLPNNFDSLVMYGNHFMDNMNFPVAAECYRRALEINPNVPDVRVDYGACLHSMGLPERAIEEFKKVIEEDPSHAIACFNIGIVYRDMNEPDSAKYYW